LWAATATLVCGTAGAAAASAPELHALAYHDVRDEVTRDHDADQFAVSTAHLARHFEWLRRQGYVVVSVDELLAARSSARPLPEKAVLLSFDDGLRSVYTHVFPLLKLFGYPAVVSVVTDWIGSAEPVLYDNRQLAAGDFVSWEQLREMQQSGLVEIASHTHAMHASVPGNPQGNEQPAAVTRLYLAGVYEDEAVFRARLAADLARSAGIIREQTGRAPRVVTWPYGAWNEIAREVAAGQAMTVSLALDASRLHGAGELLIGRELVSANPDIGDFAAMFAAAPRKEVIRALRVDLDAVHDPDAGRQEERLGRVLDTVKTLGVSHVVLQGYADTDGDGRADAVYFPSRDLPMRGDLFNRAAWQLAMRSGVRVLAALPLGSFAPRADQAGRSEADGEADSARAARIYEDLAIHASFHGLHFDEPAGVVSHDADAGLNALSLELAAVVRRHRPEIVTSRALQTTVRPSGAGLAQQLDGYLNLYDYVTLVATPAPLRLRDAEQFCARVIPDLPGREALRRTIVALPGTEPAGSAAAGEALARLAACGVQHLAWLPGALPENPPALDQLRQLMSAADMPWRP
jgi:biofilm PGA synthesis lipoprotein PgaB